MTSVLASLSASLDVRVEVEETRLNRNPPALTRPCDCFCDQSAEFWLPGKDNSGALTLKKSQQGPDVEMDQPLLAS
jgi:hypothetical protein